MSTNDKIEATIKKILSQSKKVTQDSKGYMMCCPAHDDKNPSLSMGVGRDGRVLLKCFAGCTIEQVVAGFGLRLSDLHPNEKRNIVAEYSYKDAKGEEVFQIVRLEPKSFYVRQNQDGRWVYNQKGVHLVPFRLPKLNKAVKEKRQVFIVEGEKDCNNMVKRFKLTATTFPFGAKKWQAHYAKYFKNARIVIVPDNDAVGREHAQMVAEKLNDVAKEIRIVSLPDLPDKGDISDWIRQGGTKEAFLALVEDTPLWEPAPVIEHTEDELALKARIEELNKKYATVLVRGKYVVLQPDSWDPSLNCSTIEFINPFSLEKMFAHDQVITGYSGKKPFYQNVIKAWSHSPDRRKYEGIVFDPGKDHGPEYFNLWRGFDVRPKKSHKFDSYLNHIYDVIADGDTAVYNHLIAIMADAVQLRPRPGVAVAILGKQGVGKGVFVNNFGALFGRHYLHITHGEHMTGRFNRHLAEGMIVFVDEAIWAGDKKAEGVLKGLITEERLMIEAKGVDAYAIKNHNRVFLASNHDWIVPAGLEDRRFFVIRASDLHIQDRDYFGRIQEHMDNGGREGLLRYLQQYDLTDIELTAFPRTKELANQKLLSMDLVDLFLFSVLQNGMLYADRGDFDLELSQKPWGNGVVGSDLLYKAFKAFHLSGGKKWINSDASFGIALSRIIPQRKKKRCKGVMSYIFPSLKECRDQFDAITRQDWEWPKVQEDDRD
ncbi:MULTISPECIES: primase-helicase family protein [Methylomonas]|uniref:NrS-1 polymerase-like helicase domain-containing protein n=1 Tax=Methylomonas koyamae TaxID=702114 RepID=A0A177P7V9_9GAMM|nr:primase-helicase family protein [Methylomonas koyamae]OAI26386.1 hypothetical protein A1355_18895 [Methylomonas koyamae]